MAEIPRLNGVIKALEEGKTAFVSFTSNDVETAIAMAGSRLDGVAFEMEHAPLDIPGLRHALQYMLDRRQLVDRGTLAPAVTPMVRIPPNGNEMNQWLAKQVLDIGVYGIIFPHVSSVEEARNAVSACRYPRLSSAPLYDPPGIRGDAPARAARYWGSRATGILQARGRVAAGARRRAPGGDPVRGGPRHREPAGDAQGGPGHRRGSHRRRGPEPGAGPSHGTTTIRWWPTTSTGSWTSAKEHNVPCGHPHPSADNIERLVEAGFRFLMPGAPRSFAVLNRARELTGR